MGLVFLWRSSSYLLTLGDAVASFLDEPDWWVKQKHLCLPLWQVGQKYAGDNLPTNRVHQILLRYQ